MSSHRSPTRREALLLAAAGGVGFAGRSWLPGVAAAAPAARPKSCVVLWLSGGPSQFETFDPKPDAPAEVRGEFGTIPTALPGVRVCELLPRLAKALDRFALLRSVSTTPSLAIQHSGAHNLVRFGRVPNRRDTIDRPNWGSVVSAGRANPATGLPNFVMVGNAPGRDPGVVTPGYLGYRHAPMTVPDAAAGLPNLAAKFDPASAADRLALLAEADREYAARTGAGAARSHRTNVDAALALMRSPAGAAFDLAKEPDKVRDAYGRHPFGQGCLLARRLVEVGVPFVEVTYPNVITGDGDWDTHKKHFPTLKDVLLPSLDAALPTLVAELSDRGLLDTTLVVAMGEMGRTPRLNAGASRDHFAVAFPALFAGGGVKVGQVVGATTADGTAVKDRPVNAAELLATVCRLLGVDGETEWDASTGKPIKGDGLMVPPLARTTLFDPKAKPVGELVG